MVFITLWKLLYEINFFYWKYNRTIHSMNPYNYGVLLKYYDNLMGTKGILLIFSNCTDVFMVLQR